MQITDPAKFRLKQIYQFYKITASAKVAEKLKHSIIKKIESLNKLSRRGVEEKNLKELNQGHMYLVVGNYKIIFLISENTVFVTDIFDTRQDPSKMGKI